MTEEGALTASNDNFLYLMSAAGDIVWKRRLPARPSIRPLIFDKFALVAASGEKNLYIVNLKNGKFADQINFESEIVSSVLIPGNGGVAVLEPGYVARISTHENCSK